MKAEHEKNTATKKALDERTEKALEERTAAKKALEERTAATTKALEERTAAKKLKIVPHDHEICRELFQVSSQHLTVASPMLLTHWHPMSGSF